MKALGAVALWALITFALSVALSTVLALTGKPSTLHAVLIVAVSAVAAWWVVRRVRRRRMAVRSRTRGDTLVTPSE